MALPIAAIGSSSLVATQSAKSALARSELSRYALSNMLQEGGADGEAAGGDPLGADFLGGLASAGKARGLGASGSVGAIRAGEAVQGGDFGSALLRALDGVNEYQAESSTLMERMIVDPDSVDPHDVTIAMAEANLSLNIARTILDRVVRGWKEVINTR